MTDALEFIRALSVKLIRGSAHVTEGGVTLFTPDCRSGYDALWLRDFSYMAEYAPDAITDDELRDCIEFAISGARADGWLPDRRYADGLTVYAAGMLARPVGQANLDNTPFGVFLIHEYMLRTGDRAAFARWYPVLENGMRAVPRSDKGLVYSDPMKPHSPYGFTDTVGKTGELLTESLLFWRACRFLAEMCGAYETGNARLWQALAAPIAEHIGALYDADEGAFLAATRDCRQPDVWGNALLLYYGFPLGEMERGVYKWLLGNADRYLYKGQVRHLRSGEYWQRLLTDVAAETYQNGAYWATASGWLMWCLYKADRARGLHLAAEAIRFLKDDGAYECVNEGYRKLDTFVVSAANVRGGLERIVKADTAALNEINRLIN